MSVLLVADEVGHPSSFLMLAGVVPTNRPGPQRSGRPEHSAADIVATSAAEAVPLAARASGGRGV
ncbi:MAG TPA: hypothetical protein VIR27_02990 [Mycobacteriales bacterium]